MHAGSACGGIDICEALHFVGKETAREGAVAAFSEYPAQALQFGYEPIIRFTGQQDGEKPFIPFLDIGPIEMTLLFARASFAERQQPAQAGIGRAIGRIDQQRDAA
jgi:hypothetical protein